MDIDKDIIDITCKLYSRFNFTRVDVQAVMSIFGDFISNIYIPALLKVTQERLSGAISVEASTEINKMFNRFSNPFERFDSEKKRLRIYKRIGLYVEPRMTVIEQIQDFKVRGDSSLLKMKQLEILHLPLKDSLLTFLQMEGLFDAIINYIAYLENEHDVLINFVQGELWRHKKQSFGSNDIVLPLCLYFDDIDLGNALGSHAGINQLGAVYAYIPCLPPSIASKLESIMVVSLFFSKHRKLYGNRTVFQSVISECNYLRKNGITLHINGHERVVFFAATLVIGDNLGANAILGYTQSFHNTHYCRICFADYCDLQIMTTEKSQFLRTKEQYEENVQNIESRDTGIKEVCSFNELIDYHVIENQTLDVMHDMLEGVGDYVMADVVLQLIEDNYFTIDHINKQLSSLDFGLESSNIPPPIDLQYVRKQRRFKMSSSETLFFIRYLPMILSIKIDECNEAYYLYTLLREITCIVTSDALTSSDILYLDHLVNEHHELYIRLFGALKPKFHNLTHYVRIIKQNGPLFKLSAMRFESKHRQLKAMVLFNNCRRNLLLSLGSRFLLSTMQSKLLKYEKNCIKYGKRLKKVSSEAFVSSSNMLRYEYVEVDGITYKKGVVIVLCDESNNMYFGEIDSIYVTNNNIEFECTILKMIGYSTIHCAYSVVRESDKAIVNIECLYKRSPCLLFSVNDSLYIISRDRLS